MGQKTHPKLFRLGVIETWDSKWFARHDYPKLLHEDFRIKKFLKTRLYHAGISRIEIDWEHQFIPYQYRIEVSTDGLAERRPVAVPPSRLTLMR